MNVLNRTIEEFFINVNKGETNFANLIDLYREYQRACKMNAYKDALPDDVDVLKSTCTLIKFNCLKEAA